MTAAGSHDNEKPIYQRIPMSVPHVAIYALSTAQGDGTAKAAYRLGHNWPDHVHINPFDIETIVLAVAANILRENGEAELAQLVNAAALDTFQNSRRLDELLKPAGGETP